MVPVICKDAGEVARYADGWVSDRARRHGARSIYLPAGATPEPLYRVWSGGKPDYLTGLKFLQIDEILGPEQSAGPFRNFLQSRLEPWARQFEWIGSGETQGDLAILGLGLNGHVGFHEPGVARGFYSGCVRLSAETCKRLHLAEGTWGVTYGLGAFLRAKAVLLVVTGAPKAPILTRLLKGEGDFPALALRAHPQLTIVADEAARGGKLRGIL
jgi:6-phosphogluconolactonase/glucosamine-6-phosphate isomerase/deaminase